MFTKGQLVLYNPTHYYSNPNLLAGSMYRVLAVSSNYNEIIVERQKAEWIPACHFQPHWTSQVACLHSFMGKPEMCAKCGIMAPKFSEGQILERTERSHQALHVGHLAYVSAEPPVYERGMWRYKMYGFPSCKALPGVWGEKYFKLSTYDIVMPANTPTSTGSGQNLEININLTAKEPQMLDFIIKAYPKTEDAVLVQKYFGSDLNKKFHQVLLKGHETELLNAAKELEADSSK